MFRKRTPQGQDPPRPDEDAARRGFGPSEGVTSHTGADHGLVESGITEGEVDSNEDLPALQTYKVVYKGGHPDYPKAKVGALLFALLPDAFRLSPTTGTKKWFSGLSIPYSEVLDLQVVGRQVSTVEGLLGGLDSRQLNQDNNIHIRYGEIGHEILLRLEMLTGVTVMGQAGKCRELEDRLRNLGVREKFAKVLSVTESVTDIPDQIAKLAALRDQSVLSAEEFEAKKTELLGRM